MKIRTQIPGNLASAVVSLLKVHVPDLTEAQLVAALAAYDPDRPVVPGVEFWTKAEAAEKLSVGERTVVRMAGQGQLPIIRVGSGGRDWRICATVLARQAQFVAPDQLDRGTDKGQVQGAAPGTEPGTQKGKGQNHAHVSELSTAV